MGPTALLATKMTGAYVEELVEANRIMAHCEKTEGLHLTYQPTRPKDSIFDAIENAATAAQSTRSVEHRLAAQREDKTSVHPPGRARAPRRWRRRHSSGPKRCDEMATARCEPDIDGKRVKQWDMGLAEKNHEESILAGKDGLREHARNLTTTDAKRLYDGVQREVRGRQPCVALAVAELKQPMAA